ncbi:unnamed protein product [Staurois parvus]|uniref:Uncharacterized protein n=1 Tax=Staurois parvus TaxID=386267 RepID=A0ABN9HRT8_9NEOB|nr:unnamed protein product [Staurois parvus]
MRLVVRCAPGTQRMTLALSCDQLCPITADRIPISATCQCPLMPPVSVHQCTSKPHISAYLSCLSVPPISACQCQLSVPVSAVYECCQPVLPTSASQCCL